MSKLGDGTMTNGSWTKGAPMIQGGDPTGRGAPLHMPLMVGVMVQVHRWGVHPGGAPGCSPVHGAPMLVFTKVKPHGAH